MRVKIGTTTLSLSIGDITREDTDAVVNAANSALAGGGGVDGAIHAAGGPKIMEECRKIGGCPTGSAVITTGGNLKAKYVIHTVGPVYRDGGRRDSELLASAYKSSLELAVRNGIGSLSFPSISTGAYGYPLNDAARIAVATVANFLRTDNRLSLVRFVLFSDRAFEAYKAELEKIA
jgi:O-acetyl-ADP-ribose deacetylase (regulator of RNase III)